MAHPLTSFWDLPIEGNSARPSPDRLASDVIVFICRRWERWLVVLSSPFLLNAVIHEYRVPTDCATGAPQNNNQTNLGEHLYPAKGLEYEFRHSFGRTKKLM